MYRTNDAEILPSLSILRLGCLVTGKLLRQLRFLDKKDQFYLSRPLRSLCSLCLLLCLSPVMIMRHPRQIKIYRGAEDSCIDWGIIDVIIFPFVSFLCVERS